MVAVVDGEVTRRSSTFQNFTNGINNSEADAIATGIMQSQEVLSGDYEAGSAELTVNYNPTHGPLSDIVESAVDLLPTSEVWQTGVAKQTGEFQAEVLEARKQESGGTNFINHSQGTLLHKAGVQSQSGPDSALRQALAKTEGGVTVVNYGAAANNNAVLDVLENTDLQLDGSFSNPGDIVSETIGGNNGDYLPEKDGGQADTLDPLGRLKALGNIGTLSGDSLPEYDSEGNQTNDVSSHAYTCERNCGNERNSQHDTQNKDQ